MRTGWGRVCGWALGSCGRAGSPRPPPRAPQLNWWLRGRCSCSSSQMAPESVALRERPQLRPEGWPRLSLGRVARGDSASHQPRAPTGFTHREQCCRDSTRPADIQDRPAPASSLLSDPWPVHGTRDSGHGDHHSRRPLQGRAAPCRPHTALTSSPRTELWAWAHRHHGLRWTGLDSAAAPWLGRDGPSLRWPRLSRLSAFSCASCIRAREGWGWKGE